MRKRIPIILFICIYANGGLATDTTLGMDTALLQVKNGLNEVVDLYWQNAQCFGCPLIKLDRIQPDETVEARLQTKHGNYLGVLNTAGHRLCWKKQYLINLREHGQYMLNVTEGSNGSVICDLCIKNNPPNNNIYVFWAFLWIVVVALVWIGLIYSNRYGIIDKLLFWKRNSKSFELTLSTIVSADPLSPVPTVSKHLSTQTHPPVLPKRQLIKRLVFLDAFRGLCMACIIFGNYGHGGYWFLGQSYWDGLNVGDLFFPWFIFIMGTAIPVSMNGQIRRGVKKSKIIRSILKRSALFFGFGLFAGPMYDLPKSRIPGVLQRFGITNLVCASVHLIFANYPDKDKIDTLFADITDYWAEWLIHLALLAVYLVLTFALPVPGCPRGYLGPGGLHNGGKYFNCTGGAAGYIDRVILSENHLLNSPDHPVRAVYRSNLPHDPEGILGSLTSIFICYLGLQVGKSILYYQKHKARLLQWLIWMLVTGSIGVILCGARATGGLIPINKNLWSLSYILVSASTAFAMMIVLYFIVDVWHIWNGAPFIYPGMNSIFCYLGHKILRGRFPIQWKVPDQHNPRIFVDLWGSAFFMIVTFIMYKKKIFIRF